MLYAKDRILNELDLNLSPNRRPWRPTWNLVELVLQVRLKKPPPFMPLGNMLAISPSLHPHLESQTGHQGTSPCLPPGRLSKKRQKRKDTADEHTRIWKCPECGHSTEIGPDWLAEHGGPICERCDCDMAFQPEWSQMPASVTAKSNTR